MKPAREREKPRDDTGLVFHLAEEGVLASRRSGKRRVAKAVRCPDQGPHHETNDRDGAGKHGKLPRTTGVLDGVPTKFNA